MCGRAAISISAADIVSACRAVGCDSLPANHPPPDEYHVGSKSCEDKTRRNPTGKRGVEAWPCLVRAADGTVGVRTLKWGIQQLATHNMCVPRVPLKNLPHF